LAQAIGLCAIQQGHRVRYRETHVLLEELADATLERRRKEVMTELATVPLMIIDDLGMRKLPTTAAEDLLELIMRRYERASTLLTRPVGLASWRLAGSQTRDQRRIRVAATATQR
jgi:DNA replication protein DnaC